MESKESAIEAFRKVGGSVPEFDLKGHRVWARVVSVYDGDTMTVVFPLFGNPYRFSVRLNGIDTCEIKSKLEENKRRAIRARNAVLQWVMPEKAIDANEAYTKKQIDEMLASDVHIVYLVCDTFDKYGRVLGDVYASPEDQDHFAERLVKLRLAYRYFGDTKLTEQEQIAKLDD